MPSPTPGWVTRTRRRADLEKFERGDGSESQKLYLAVIVAAELGRGNRRGVREARSGPQETAPGFRTALRCRPCLRPGISGCCPQGPGEESVAVRASPQPAPQGDRERLRRLQAHAGGRRPRPDPRPTGVRRHHEGGASGAILRRRLDGRCSGSRRIPILGLDPTAHLQRCRELASQGYRMVALSVARTSPEGPPITASVWHRPVITEETRDRLAERQARAAVALFGWGKRSEILPLLRHSADPRLRSFIVNWLNPSGCRLRHHRRRTRPTGSCRPPRPTPPPGSRRWMPSSSTPRPRSGGR